MPQPRFTRPLRVYTSQEVAKILQVKPATVYRWCREGKILGTKYTGKLWRITELELNRLLTQGHAQPEEARRGHAA